LNVAAKQLTLFKDRLPKKPYHTDDLNLGLSIAKAQSAISSRYIQPNGPTHKYWLIFDVDLPNAAYHWYDVGAPAPNISVINRSNGHAHLIYGLETSVRTAPDGSSKALRYAAAIEGALCRKLNADANYGGLICKNPLHEKWDVTTWEGNLYDLDWLSDYLDLSDYGGSKRLPNYGLGRNCNLFDYLSKWSYKAIRQGWPDYERWFEACHERASAYNKKAFSDPLPLSEVKATTRSIARWTHKHLTKAGFSEWQAKQGKKGGVAKGAAYSTERELSRKLREEGKSLREIASMVGVSKSAVASWTTHIKK